ncbi:hypothetical protein ACFRH4_30820 [Streptomyces mirabilis]|uniref:hypothetical protein n=1 Tax=Streptomyces mirabilis TaxID=68239 RepID=UPI0036B76C50
MPQVDQCGHQPVDESQLMAGTGIFSPLTGPASRSMAPPTASRSEDAGVLRDCLAHESDMAKALARYEAARTTRFDGVRDHAAAVERASDAAEFAHRYAAFSHWMLTTAPAT